MDKLSEQFLAYLLLANKDIPASVKESAQLKADDPNRVDILMAYIKIIKKARNTWLRIWLTFQSCRGHYDYP